MSNRTAASDSAISVIGLGLMGTALTQRLHDHGWRVHVWNRTPSKATPLLTMGAAWCDRPLAATTRVIVSLYSSDVVEEVLAPWMDDISAETIVIDTTTGSPESSERLAEQVSKAGGVYLDAPISGSSEQTRRGEATVMVAGSLSAFERCRDLWDVLSTHCFHVGRSGNAARTKLVSNLILGLNRVAAAEGLLFAEALGLDLDTTLRVLRASPASSRQLETKGPKMIAGDLSPQALLSQHLKDVRLMLAAADKQHVSLRLTDTHRQLLEEAEALGHGAHDNSAIFQAMREMTE